MAAASQPSFARAISADYSGALAVVRSAKNWLFLLLLVLLLIQVGVFFTFRYDTDLDIHNKAFAPLEYLTALTDLAGVALCVVLALVLLLIVNIMLVGRVVGLERVTSAFVWCLLLLVLLFPWQCLLTSPATASPTEPPAADAATRPVSAPVDFKVPGALYTWAELTHPQAGARFATDDPLQALLHWSRYVIFPCLAAGVLVLIQGKSSQGLKMAMGEGGHGPAADGSI